MAITTGLTALNFGSSFGLSYNAVEIDADQQHIYVGYSTIVRKMDWSDAGKTNVIMATFSSQINGLRRIDDTLFVFSNNLAWSIDLTIAPPSTAVFRATLGGSFLTSANFSAVHPGTSLMYLSSAGSESRVIIMNPINYSLSTFVTFNTVFINSLSFNSSSDLFFCSSTGISGPYLFGLAATFGQFQILAGGSGFSAAISSDPYASGMIQTNMRGIAQDDGSVLMFSSTNDNSRVLRYYNGSINGITYTSFVSRVTDFKVFNNNNVLVVGSFNIYEYAPV